MIKKTIAVIPSFYAGDNTYLKEILHPFKENIELAYSLAYATIGIGEQSLPHILLQSELYIFLEGEALMLVDGQEIPMKKGEVFLVPGGAEQYVINKGNKKLEFYCIVSPPWEEGKEIIL